MRIRQRYLNHNPKAELYVGLGDFSFFRLELEGASLNGGFGKAFNLTYDDLLCPTDVSIEIGAQEKTILDEYNQNQCDALSRLAAQKAPQQQEMRYWKLIGIDPDGFDIAQGDIRLRFFFPASCTTAQDASRALYNMINN